MIQDRTEQLGMIMDVVSHPMLDLRQGVPEGEPIEAMRLASGLAVACGWLNEAFTAEVNRLAAEQKASPDLDLAQSLLDSAEMALLALVRVIRRWEGEATAEPEPL